MDATRRTGSAPNGADNAVFDLAIESIGDGWPREYVFGFTEQLVGDYDQNGLVGVSDLTPLGMHFNGSVTYEEPMDRDGITWWPGGDPKGGDLLNWRLARIDGNHDGLINVSDITPIAQHWQENCCGYRVYLTPPGSATPELLPNPEDATATVTLFRPAIDQWLPVCYHFKYTAQAAGEHQIFVVPCDSADGAEGSPSRVLSFTVPPEGENILPEVSLAANPDAGEAPLEVQFVATAQDLDGEITLYKWDLDGDGWFEDATGATPFIEYTYTVGGTYNPVVQVTDNDGATAIASVTVQVSASTANLPPEARFFASALSGPLPLQVEFNAASSSDPDGEIVLYEWDVDGDGEYDVSGASAVTVQHEYMTETMTKAGLRVIDDDGAVDTFSTYISPGTSWRVRESEALIGINPGLADVQGKPAVAYVAPQDGYFSSGPLYLALALDSAGSDWEDPVEVAADALRCAVVEVDGQPAVAYLVKYSPADYHLCYRRATDITVGAWADELVLDTWALDFFYLECMIIDGHPALLYSGTETNLEDRPAAIKYVRAADALGTTWPEPIVTYILGDEGLGSLDLDVVNNRPAMLLKMQKLNSPDPGHRGVYYQASDEAGATWYSTPYEFTYMGTNALCVADGRPALVHQNYKDDGEGILYFLDFWRAEDADGTTWADGADITTDAVDDTPLCPRLVADEQRIYCCYLDWGTNQYGQMAVVSLDPAGNAWSAGQVLDPQRPDTYFGSSLALVGGRAMLAYAVVVEGECRVRLAEFVD